MNPNPSNGSENLASSLRQLVNDADRLMKDAARGGDTQFNELRDRVSGELRRMRVRLDELEDTTMHRARRAARSADLAVQQHPYTAIGIAAAAGVLIGLLASTTRR